MIAQENERCVIQILTRNRRKFKKIRGRGVKIMSIKCCEEKGCFGLRFQGLGPNLSVGKKHQPEETLLH